MVHRQKHCHCIWITPFHSRSFFSREKRGKREQEEYKYKKRWLVAKNLADAFFSGLLSTFFSLQCGTRGSNEESGVPHDQLLHLSNLQHHHLLVSDLSPCNISSHPQICFASSVLSGLLSHIFGEPNSHFSWNGCMDVWMALHPTAIAWLRSSV